MKEINYFVEHLNVLTYLKKIGYHFIDERIYNEKNKNLLFYKRSYLNPILDKKCTIYYYPTSTTNLSGLIDFNISLNNQSIDLSTYQAYKKTGKPVSQKDKFEFKIVVDRLDWETSLLTKLKELNDLLESEFSFLLSSEKWLTVPQLSERDKY